MPPSGHLLQRPGVPVGVAEAGVLDAGSLLLDLAHLDALAGERVAGLGDVLHDQMEPSERPGSMAMAGRPAPSTIEQDDPGGVSWTTRIESPGRTSWSSSKPTLST